MPTTIGYDAAAAIPVGATVDRVYFCEPGSYTHASERGEFDTYLAALEAAIAHQQARLDTAADDDEVPTRIWIDVRWSMSYPAGGSKDAAMSRTSYADVVDAIEHAARIRRDAPAGGRS